MYVWEREFRDSWLEQECILQEAIRKSYFFSPFFILEFDTELQIIAAMKYEEWTYNPRLSF